MKRREFLKFAGAAGVSLSLDTPNDVAALSDREDATTDGPDDSLFIVRMEGGGIASLKRRSDAFDTDYIQSGRRLGEVVLRFRENEGEWQTVDTRESTDAVVESSPGGGTHRATYRITRAGAPALQLDVRFTIGDATIDWDVSVENLTSAAIEVGDLAVSLPMNGNFRDHPTTAVLKHSLISGDGSFLFWMRRNSVGPYLTMTPRAGTQLEYWESQGGFRAFIHSAAAGAAATAEHGTKWRQPHTSATLAARGRRDSTKSYGFRLHWADNYDAVREVLYDEGLIDVHVVPGMTVPSDLSARFALRTKHRIASVDAEFPKETRIRSLGTNGEYRIYEVRFSRLGENRLTVRYADNRQLHLEFFATEPVETLIRKRAAFIAAHQHRDPSKWYNGLLAEWNMESHVLLSPDNYDRIKGWRIYAVTCDDPGLSKPAFLSAKNALYPKQEEVAALDYYIEHFVWGGLQRDADEEYTYGIYGIPDWKQNRDSSDPGRNGRRHIWRIYDYPHIALMYYGMYRVAKDHPQIRTQLSATEYLRRAYGTAVAMFTIPFEIERWSAYQTGLYNEIVYPDIIDSLEAEGLTEQAERLRIHWERKVRAFIVDRPDLFRSEYAFDSTGFESTHALVKYAFRNAESLGRQRPANDRMPVVTRDAMKQFLELQIQANLFCRGWLETAYYYLGSDYRGGAGDRYTLTYMSQMGGWAVLDYALHDAADPFPFVRLGYASYLSAWALMNSGTPESNYGYWYPGPENDGGAGGGFEPSPFGQTWLEQPHHRGSWYYSCEIDLGFCGALRGAATVLSDDPIFGRFCFGGDWKQSGRSIEVTPRDGVRKRFHAVIGGRKLHVTNETDRFARDARIITDETLSTLRFTLESENTQAHTARVRIGGLPAGRYSVAGATVEMTDGVEMSAELALEGGRGSYVFARA